MNLLKSVVLLSFLFFALSFFTACDETTTDPGGNNLGEANALAMEGFNQLNQKAQELEGTDLESAQSGDDIFPNSEYTTIKDIFESAIDKDSNNPAAHLGLAILELFSINYDNNLWNLINDANGSTFNKRIMNNQLRFLGTAPEALLKQTGNTLQNINANLSIARIQNVVESSVLPKLSSAIEHLNFAVNLADSNAIVLESDGETVEIDPGEIYLFRASLYAVSAGFRFFTLYDVDLFDQQGGYSWIDSLLSSDYSYGFDSYDVQTVNGQTYLYLTDNYENEQEIASDSLAADVVKYNLLSRSSFLTYRGVGVGAKIKSDILHAIADLENSVSYIENETDDQSDDIIKFSYIQFADSSIANSSADDPDFAQNWNNIHDVLNWLNGLFTQPYTFTENGTSFQVDLGRLFVPGMADLKEYLPYYQWKDASAWRFRELDYSWQMDNYGYSYSFFLAGQEDMITIDAVDVVVFEYYDAGIDPVVLLDAAGGNEIDPDEVMPYFRDYTFNGIFPDMTRDKMQTLIWDEPTKK